MNLSLLTQESFDFLKKIKENNNKTWFVENKNNYNTLIYIPLCNIVMLLQDTLIAINPNMITEPKKCISRIYNDLRFSRNKAYLKDCVWLTFKTNEKHIQPAYFLEIKDASFRYGMGYYHANSETMQKYRDNIDANIKKFREIINTIDQAEDLTIFGDYYKKTFPCDYGGKINDYYNLKSIYVAFNSSDISLLQCDEFYKKIIKDFYLLKDLYLFLRNEGNSPI